MSDLANLYASVYHDPKCPAYGCGLTRCSPFLRRIWDAGLESVVSFGCGTGDELIAIHGMVPRCLGIDFALPPKVWRTTAGRSLSRIQADLATMDPTMRFDAVVSFDVLEHLRDDQLDAVLRLAASIAPRACLVVASMPDPYRLSDGRVVDLHLIQQRPAWWVERVASVTGWHVEVQELEYPERFGLWCGVWS